MTGSKGGSSRTADQSSDTDTSSSDDSNSNIRTVNIKGVGTREMGDVDGVYYAVMSVKRATRIGDSMSGSKADGQYVIVTLSAANETKETHDSTISLITLVDSQGRSYSPSSNGETALSMSGDQSADMLISELQPGVVKSVDLVYDVPQGDSGLKLNIPHGTFSSGSDAIIRLPE